jgi:hypothetical protein
MESLRINFVSLFLNDLLMKHTKIICKTLDKDINCAKFHHQFLRCACLTLKKDTWWCKRNISCSDIDLAYSQCLSTDLANQFQSTTHLNKLVLYIALLYCTM